MSMVLPASISLDGVWEFVPGSDPHQPAVTIDVPGLWEAAGFLDLDGEAWYSRTFDLEEARGGRWTLEFGAVMDEAEVFLNGVRVGGHEGAFTPFAFDVTEAVRAGTNHLEVRVQDIERADPRHSMTAHGKQGWMNHVFPSPPSLYMTYGGIWQSVALKRHGDVRIDDVWINSNPSDLVVEIELAGIPGAAAEVDLALLDRLITRTVRFEGGVESLSVRIGPIEAGHWSPDAPVLHDLEVAVRVGGQPSDTRRCRFGLRSVELTRAGLLLDGRVVKIKSALVQGFRADTLYGEGSCDEIAAEVLAAKDAGLNMLRLHIKAFDPRYLAVCDEVGMLVHCDIPVAEPIAHAALASDGPVADAAVQAACAQVRRDRNHPSVVLWSAMNELGAEALETRKTPGYEGFARRLYDAVSSADPTRPVIENDWIEPDPEEVFCSSVLTAHWYGRLSASYLATLSEKTERWAREAKPLFVSEFGDWGLPELDVARDEFWAYGASLAAAIDESGWTGDTESFVEGTQHYQGIADRLQIEIFRSTPGVIGWCVTELTDVPQELNGLFDLERNPKSTAIAEISCATQPVLPVIRRTSWTLSAGSTLEDDVILVNDGPRLVDGRLRLRAGSEEINVTLGIVEAGSISAPIPIRFRLPDEPGTTPLEIVVSDGDVPQGGNSYPIHVVGAPQHPGRICVVADDVFEQTLMSLGADVSSDADALLVVGEECLDALTGQEIDRRLRAGGDVVVFAQSVDAARFLPVVPAEMTELATEWGSTPFLFTTSATGFASLPEQTILTTEILEATPTGAWTSLGDPEMHVETLVGVLKPYPAQVTGCVVGRLPVHGGTLTLCQLPIAAGASAGRALSLSLLGDVIGYARTPLEVSKWRL